MLTLLAAGGLGACNALPRVVEVREGQPTTITLVPRRGTQLTLQNESSGYAADVYSDGADRNRKVVPDAELQALLDIYAAEQLFELSAPDAPANARDVLRLQQAGRAWVWARRGSMLDDREAGFAKALEYFLRLYNGNTAFHSAPDPAELRNKTGLREDAGVRGADGRGRR